MHEKMCSCQILEVEENLSLVLVTYLFICLFVCLFVYLFIYLFIYLVS